VFLELPDTKVPFCDVLHQCREVVCNGTKRPTLCTVPYTRYLYRYIVDASSIVSKSVFGEKVNDGRAAHRFPKLLKLTSINQCAVKRSKVVRTISTVCSAQPNINS
jgi:hypothetical protein